MSDDHDFGEIKKPKVRKSEALWMMTFSDLSLILMCFFALILSFSTINNQKFDNITGNLKSPNPAEKKKEKNLKSIEEQIKKAIQRKNLQKQVSVKLDADGLNIEFRDKLLFSSGSANPNPATRRTLGEVMTIISKSPDKYHIELEGHTDNVPLSGRGRYRSNWDLSAARSVTLLNDFKRRGVKEERMHVLAYAHTKPKVPITGKRGRALAVAQAANRRVVIRIR